MNLVAKTSRANIIKRTRECIKRLIAVEVKVVEMTGSEVPLMCESSKNK
jgi:hypothetical protein